MRTPTIWLPLALLGSGLCAPQAAQDWEYRALTTHAYYGVASGGQLLGELAQSNIAAATTEAMNRWGADGWDLIPGWAAGQPVVLRRSRSAPQPFEVRLIPEQEIGSASAEDVQRQINALVADGFQIQRRSELWIELRRSL